MGRSNQAKKEAVIEHFALKARPRQNEKLKGFPSFQPQSLVVIIFVSNIFYSSI